MKTSLLETITRMGSIFDAGTVGWKTRSRSSMCNEQGQFLFCHVNCKASEVVVFKEGKEKINTTFCWDICKPHKQSGTILQQWGMTDLHCVIIHSCIIACRTHAEVCLYLMWVADPTRCCFGLNEAQICSKRVSFGKFRRSLLTGSLSHAQVAGSLAVVRRLKALFHRFRHIAYRHSSHARLFNNECIPERV